MSSKITIDGFKIHLEGWPLLLVIVATIVLPSLVMCIRYMRATGPAPQPPTLFDAIHRTEELPGLKIPE